MLERYDRVQQLEAENAALKHQVESFTPGGSEFNNDPERCLQWIKDRMSTVTEQVKKRKEADAQLALTEKALELACDHISEVCVPCPLEGKPSCSPRSCDDALKAYYLDQAKAGESQ